MVYHVFAYLNKHENSKIVFDPTTVELANPNVFKKVDWSDIYDMEDVKEELPPRMPEPRGRSVKMSVFVDADHAGNKVTRTIAHWSFDFSPECTYSMLFEEAEHSGKFNIWLRICGDANCKGYGYCFEVQAEDVRHTN